MMHNILCVDNTIISGEVINYTILSTYIYIGTWIFTTVNRVRQQFQTCRRSQCILVEFRQQSIICRILNVFSYLFRYSYLFLVTLSCVIRVRLKFSRIYIYFFSHSINFYKKYMESLKTLKDPRFIVGRGIY